MPKPPPLELLPPMRHLRIFECAAWLGSFSRCCSAPNSDPTPLNLRPRDNVAPSQNVAVVRANDEGRGLAMLRWGLIPSRAKDPAVAWKPINARSETAAERPSFRSACRETPTVLGSRASTFRSRPTRRTT